MNKHTKMMNDMRDIENQANMKIITYNHDIQEFYARKLIDRKYDFCIVEMVAQNNNYVLIIHKNHKPYLTKEYKSFAHVIKFCKRFESIIF